MLVWKRPLYSFSSWKISNWRNHTFHSSILPVILMAVYSIVCWHGLIIFTSLSLLAGMYSMLKKQQCKHFAWNVFLTDSFTFLWQQCFWSNFDFSSCTSAWFEHNRKISYTQWHKILRKIEFRALPTRVKPMSLLQKVIVSTCVTEWIISFYRCCFVTISFFFC